MKKIISFVVTVCMCLSLFAMLTACQQEHTHAYKGEWASDDKNHWHACEGCSEVSDKAEHSWNNGEVTLEPTATADGEKTYTCTVCGATKKESVKFEGHVHSYKTEWASDAENHWHACNDASCTEVSDKAAHTFDEGKASEEAKNVIVYTCTVCGATKNETIQVSGMTKAEWEALSNPEIYTNFTLKSVQVDNYFTTETIFMVAEGELYLSTTFYNPETNESSTDTTRRTLTDEMKASLLPALPTYEFVEYDPASDVYCLKEAITAGMFNYTVMKITVKDGKIAAIYSEMFYEDSRDGRIDVVITNEYTNYGTTVLPAEDVQ